jgi:hypothetical protein
MKEKIGMFLISFLIIFTGMSFANIIGCVIYGFSGGAILLKIAELPYIFYTVFSLIISAIYSYLVFRKNKK